MMNKRQSPSANHKHQYRPIWGRLLLAIIGAMILMWGSTTVLLGLIGTRDTATITSIRRQGGQRNEVIPNRYTYSIGYTFEPPDGRTIDGTTTHVGSPIYSKASGNSTQPVRYFAAWPYINALEADTGLHPGPFLLILAGGTLLHISLKAKKT